jgi:two-component system, LuxR family, sensor kinase FixL
MKLHRQLLLTHLGIVSVVLVAVLALAVDRYQKTLEENIGMELAHLAEAAATDLEIVMQERVVDLRVLSQADVFEADDTQAMSDYLGEIVAVSHDYVALSVIDMSGGIIASSNPERIGEIYERSERESLDLLGQARVAKQNEVFVGKVHIDEEEATLELHLLTPITDRDNRAVIRVLDGIVNLEGITRLIHALDDRTVGDKASYLVNAAGKVLVSKDSRATVLSPLQDIRINPHLQDLLRETESGYTSYTDSRGDKVLAGYASAKRYGTNLGGGWSVLTVAPEEAIFLPVKKLRTSITRIGFFAIFVAGIMSLILARAITNPIARLKDAAIEISKGKLGYKAQVVSKDEIGLLATAFNQMSTDLRDSTVSKDYVDNIIASMIDTLIVLDPQGILKTVNKATCDLLGFSEKELIGQPIGTILAEEEEEEEEEEKPFAGTRLQTLIQKGYLRDYDITYKTKSGEKIPVNFSGAVMRDKDGQLSGIVGIARDMRQMNRLMQMVKVFADAEHKRVGELQDVVHKLRVAERALTISKESFHNIVERHEDGILVLNHLNKVVYCNPSIQNLFQKPAEALIGESFPFSIAQGHTEKISIVRSSGDVGDGELYGIPTEWDGSAATLLTIRDVTVRVRAEERQKTLLRDLERTNKELNDFAYVVSHDLKAPLRGISSLAGWIATDYTDRLDEEGREKLRMLDERVRRMHTLIEGILEYSRIGRVQEEHTDLDLKILLPEIIDLIAPPAHIQIKLEGEFPAVHYDKARIHQVFQNLLSNAIKAIDKEQGHIKVSARDNDGYWLFEVSDNGCGIDEKYQGKIFRLFERLGTSNQGDGTGIGLSLVKRIVEYYGGEVSVDSSVGEGSIFRFTLPKVVVNEYGRRKNEG